ncbi:ribokinase [Candidatus Hydrogenedentota bacterium]
MKILNFGSLNIDHVYQVDHISAPGETIAANGYEIHGGGKGANQSLALAKGGAEVLHAGNLGKEGEWLRDNLAKAGVNVASVNIVEQPGGHAIIQVDSQGENSIVVFGGANKQITSDEIDKALACLVEGDFLLLQNEINAIAEIMEKASAIAVRICFNPAPMGAEVHDYPLHLVNIFIVNETEAADLSGQADPEDAAAELASKYPESEIVLTLGEKGVLYLHGGNRIEVPAQKVEAVDTTAAGDTFTGFFLAAYSSGMDVQASLERGCRAAAICVTRKGATPSIPLLSEIE